MMDRGQFKRSCMGNHTLEASYYKSIFRGCCTYLSSKRGKHLRGLACCFLLMGQRVRYPGQQILADWCTHSLTNDILHQSHTLIHEEFPDGIGFSFLKTSLALPNFLFPSVIWIEVIWLNYIKWSIPDHFWYTKTATSNIYLIQNLVGEHQTATSFSLPIQNLLHAWRLKAFSSII